MSSQVFENVCFGNSVFYPRGGGTRDLYINHWVPCSSHFTRDLGLNRGWGWGGGGGGSHNHTSRYKAPSGKAGPDESPGRMTAGHSGKPIGELATLAGWLRAGISQVGRWGGSLGEPTAGPARMFRARAGVCRWGAFWVSDRRGPAGGGLRGSMRGDGGGGGGLRGGPGTGRGGKGPRASPRAEGSG